MDLAEAVDELYAVAPADFIAVRTRLVARAKQEAPHLVTELQGLRKPTGPAWLLNRVARREPQVITDLLDLGERMRTAQAKGDGLALSAARPERHEAIEALVAAARRAAAAADAPFGAAAADGVSSTAVAALADPASGSALASGRLLRPLTYAGFGEVELDDAVAVLRLVPTLPQDADEEGDKAPEQDRQVADDQARRLREQELAEAREALREHERALGAARLAHSEALTALEAADAQVARLEQDVARAAQHLTDLETRPTA